MNWEEWMDCKDLEYFSNYLEKMETLCITLKRHFFAEVFVRMFLTTAADERKGRDLIEFINREKLMTIEEENLLQEVYELTQKLKASSTFDAWFLFASGPSLHRKMIDNYKHFSSKDIWDEVEKNINMIKSAIIKDASQLNKKEIKGSFDLATKLSNEHYQTLISYYKIFRDMCLRQNFKCEIFKKIEVLYLPRLVICA